MAKLINITFFYVITILITVFPCHIFSQNPELVLHTNTKELSIKDGNLFRENYWKIDPEIELDIYTADKYGQTKVVSFISDVDSIPIELKPRTSIDFVVVLNGKDSCFTRVESGLQDVKFEDGIVTIPFKLSPHNNIVVETVLDHKDTLDMMFHSDARSAGITLKTLERLGHVDIDGKVLAESWGGQNEAAYSKGHALSLGQMTWKDQVIWTGKHSGKGTDGKIGPHLFENKLIEFDFDQGKMIVHNTPSTISSDYKKFPLKFNQSSMFVEIDMKIGVENFKNDFLIHTGYSGGLLLNDKFSKEYNLGEKLEIIKESELRDSYDNVLKKKEAILPTIVIGDYNLHDVPVGFFEGKVGNQHLNVIGGQVLKKFNVILDLQEANIYLKPNENFDLGFDR